VCGYLITVDANPATYLQAFQHNCKSLLAASLLQTMSATIA